MSDMQLVICGSSAGLASAHRASSSYLLDLGERGVLLDCGDGATRNFLAAGYDPALVGDIFISHTDPDHWCGLPYFIVQRHLSRTESPLVIRCPEEAIETFQRMLIMGNLFPEKLRFDIRFLPLSPHSQYDIGPLSLTTYPTNHLERLSALAEQHGHPNRGECFAMRCELEALTLLYSADLGALEDLDSVPTPIDWLLIETSHIVTSDLWPWAAERGIRRIILTHLSDDFDPAVTLEAPKHTDAEILIADDGLALPIS